MQGAVRGFREEDVVALPAVRLIVLPAAGADPVAVVPAVERLGAVSTGDGVFSLPAVEEDDVAE
jgi:hypothetical protein